ncbi:Amino acid transporter, transmembrane [Corchorus olitorius]|uniref:Amino acid transporter, transmembrane n=1 Tax=Corchorus olitorius TaxID=93759 RepID=A0A1R3J622_9ROSI|nr:Amino acid transporter, transmembrane [Corchorus olitorius]
MGTLPPNSKAVAEDAKLSQHQNDNDQLDAGALFVLKSKGSWLHCGYHLSTSIVAPPLLSLPFAFTFLGWAAGILCLVIGAMVTFYSYNLLSLVLEHHAQLGRRHLRFRDMANDILGPRWGRYFVGPIQFMVCYGAVIACTLLGGQCMKAIYLLSEPNGSMKLYEFVIIFGNSSKGPKKDYTVEGDTTSRLFGIFNAIAIIATTYGNGIIPEIQATIAPPVKGKMFKGLLVCYTVLIVTFFTVAISGYWAFGNQSEGLLLSNFVVDGRPLVPRWFILMTNIFTILQLSAVGVVYLQPTNEVLERTFGDPNSKEFAARNVIPRVVSRSLSVVISTTISAMLPFFGDINSVIGAFGFIPLDFILPVVFFNLTFKPSKKSGIFWLNVAIAVVFSAVGGIAAVAAVRQISLDAKTYRLFANV